MVSSRPLQTPIARALLAKIRAFKGLPFAIHDLINQEWQLADVNKGLAELLQVGMVHAFGPLIEEAHGMVAQAENSVLVDEKGQVIITTR